MTSSERSGDLGAISALISALISARDPQAVERSKGSFGHGTQWGMAAVEMALLRQTALGGAGRKFFMGFGDPEEPADASKPKKVGSKQVGF